MELEVQGKSIFEKDIVLFDSNNKRNTKDNNDENNKLREQIINAIINKFIPETWYENKMWCDLRNELMNYILHFGIDYISVKCRIKAGRKHNCDFEFIFTLTDNTELYRNVEFKFNTVCAMNCPQILSLASNECDYAEIFYDNYLPKIAKLYGITHLLPDKETYLRYIHQPDFKKLQFFQNLRDNENKYKRAKLAIVNKSIHEFLKTYTKKISYEYFQNKFKNQSDKNYLCYYKGQIYIDKIKPKELQITSHRLKSSKNYYNTIILYTKTSTELHMRFRWKNHNGILFPAWQIKLHRFDDINNGPIMNKVFNSKY